MHKPIMSNKKTNNLKLSDFKLSSITQKKSKHFPSSVREWKNSIYAYNKYSLLSIPSTTISVSKIIRSYFSLFNATIERKMRTKRLLLRLRRLSSNRIYLSNSEYKHTNNKVLINIYLYNKQKYNYLIKLKKNYLKEIIKRKGKVSKNSFRRNLARVNSSANIDIINNLKFTYNKSMDILKKINSGKYILKKINKSKYILIKVMKDNPNYTISSFKDITKWTANFYKKVLTRSMKRLLVYFFYKQLIYINRSKLNYNYLHILKYNLEKVYNKNVEFNLINLKNLFLNSDIMSEVVRLKLTRNRRRILRLMNNIKNKAVINRNPISLEKKLDPVHIAEFKDLRNNNDKLKAFIIKSLKYKDITGYRLEAKGRLTRRNKAARAITKVRYKGNLSDLDASRKGLSSIILKGNLRSNVQYTKCYSRTRIGTFGLKGWVSGY